MPQLLLWTSFILTLAGFFSQFGWAFDLTSHFRLQYLLIQILCITLCLFQKRKILLFITIIFALINLGLIIPYYLPKQNHTGQNYSHTLKIFLFNIHSENTNYQGVRDLITKDSPDVLALVEIDERWIKELGPIIRSYPYFKEISQENNFGIGLYSKFPLTDLEIKYFVNDQIPSIVGKLTYEGQNISVIFTHPMPPASLEHYGWRNTQYEEIALLKPTLENRVILLGDLNSTSWSYHFQKLKKELNLKDSREGFGLQTSWPSFLPYVGITIDHCLVSKNFIVLERKVGPNVGSDHLPVIIKVVLVGK